MSTTSEGRAAAHGPGTFATTQWSIVLAAAGTSSSAANLALAQLCQRYWYPLYAYIRRRGQSTHSAEDLTQEFFTRLLQKHSLVDVDREKGRFRSFLLASLKHFLANEYDRNHSQKRGGGHPVVSLNRDEADSRYGLEPSHDLTPEMLFERRWALAVLDHVLIRLGEELTAEGKQTQFERLKPYLAAGRADLKYGELARELQMSEGAVKVAVHRLRKRYRELLRDEIGQTVSHPDEIDEEIRYLRSCL